MSRPLLVVDTETTSLTPDYETGAGTIWELAVIELDPDGGRTEHVWRMEPDLAVADTAALRVGRFYERTANMCATCRPRVRAYDLAHLAGGGDAHWSDPAAVAGQAARLLNDATLLIAVPTFDDPYIKAFLRAYGQAPAWHYRARDFGSMAHGWLHGRAGALFAEPDRGVLPAIDASTDEFALALGLDLGRYTRHSALGDCRIVADGLDVMYGRTP